jgi:hypothetical protein|nr:MAG TPA: hypothetical protein [Caudoviricetes sp.]
MTLFFIATIIITILLVIIGISLVGWQIKEKAFTGNREVILIIIDSLYFAEVFVILLSAYINLR